MFIDSHCHLDRLDLSPYGEDFDQMLSAAKSAGVNRILSVSISLQQFPDMYRLIEPYRELYASVGTHPLSAKDEVATIEQLKELANNSKVIAIGETGLDYYYQTDTAELQQESFKLHLDAAKELKLPVIVHTRDAQADTLSHIKQYGCEQSAGVLHCFTENWEMASAAIDLNYMISFSGIVTFRNADELRKVVKKVPLDKILIETDAPYLAPVPHRGKKNEPKYVAEVAQCIADLKGISVEELADVTSNNFYTLFSKAKEEL